MSRTGAALVVLLTTLVHVLACAHGPTPTGIGRVDTILATSTANCRHTAAPTGNPTAEEPDPAEDSEAQCWGTDEPTVQPPSDIAPAGEAVPCALPVEPIGALADVVPGRPLWPPPSTASSVQQERARLGVWRT
ncbi:hypothetical protein ACFYTG_39565 [Streptomyces mirabilis]|uniref:hypothetical protein n=1 Tax=Streptomyces mirabilis TaxID=68239 RepID=UPI0036A04E28